MHVTGVYDSDYYKFKYPNSDSFDLTPDHANELIDAREALEKELEKNWPGCSVGIARDGLGYHLTLEADSHFHPDFPLDENFVGWRVVTEES